MPARPARLQPSTGERPQERDDGEEENGMASLVCLLLEKQLGLHFIPQPRAAICPPPSRAPPPPRPQGMEQWLVEWVLDDQREKTIPFSTSWTAGMASDCISSSQPRQTKSRAKAPAFLNEPVSARRQAIRKTRGRRG